MMIEKLLKMICIWGVEVKSEEVLCYGLGDVAQQRAYFR